MKLPKAAEDDDPEAPPELDATTTCLSRLWKNKLLFAVVVASIVLVGLCGLAAVAYAVQDEMVADDDRGSDTSPVDGGWGPWSVFGDCSTEKTCGPGTKWRSRACDNPPPSHGGKTCEGNNVDVTTCEERTCPTQKPEVTSTTEESTSDATEVATTTVTEESTSVTTACKSNEFTCRTSGSGCVDLSKICDGSPDCTDSSDERGCPIDGGWGQWYAFGVCSTEKTCGPGLKWRRRFCNNPPPNLSGKQCEGNKFDITTCEVRSCPEDSAVCHLPKDVGLPCEPYVPVIGYFYNYMGGFCEQFTWDGCDGNANRFMTKTHCERNCLPAYHIGIKSPRVKYSEAVSACRHLSPDHPYTLAMARTKEEAKALEQFLNDNKGNVDELKFWIGLSRKPGETNFTWADGTTIFVPGQDKPFLNLTLPLEPYHEGQDCWYLVWDLKVSPARWSVGTVDCGTIDKYNYVCQRDGKCDIGWSYLTETDQCYRKPNFRHRYSFAVHTCAALGGLVASVNSPVQQEHIETLIGSDRILLGITNSHHAEDWRLEKGDWILSDGSNLTWTNWDIGEPNIYKQHKHCVVMNDGDHKWKAEYCLTSYRYICSKPSYDTPRPQKAGDKVSEEEDWTWLVLTAGVLAVVASVCVSAYIVMRWRKRQQAEVDAAGAAAANADEGGVGEESAAEPEASENPPSETPEISYGPGEGLEDTETQSQYSTGWTGKLGAIGSSLSRAVTGSETESKIP